MVHAVMTVKIVSKWTTITTTMQHLIIKWEAVQLTARIQTNDIEMEGKA